MPRVELIYDADCPHIAAARTSLLQAFSQANIEPRWLEWERTAPDSPSYAAMYGSPTILVSGVDVAGGTPTANPCCRLYRQADGRYWGAPSVTQIAACLRNRPVTAVAIEGRLADCCAGQGPDEATLRAAGLGQGAL